MRRYAVPTAFLFCVVGLGASLYVGAGLAAFLFALAAMCFAAKAWGWWAHGLVFDRRSQALTLEDQLNAMLTAGADELFTYAVDRSVSAEASAYNRKREAFRRYREYWAGVGQ